MLSSHFAASAIRSPPSFSESFYPFFAFVKCFFHLSLCFNEPIKQKPPIPPSLVEKCIRTDANLGKIGWNCCTASRGGGCSPCLLGGGLEWKEFEKAPQIDSKIGIVDNLRIWSHTTKLFKCLWIHGKKDMWNEVQLIKQPETNMNPKISDTIPKFHI